MSPGVGMPHISVCGDNFPFSFVSIAVIPGVSKNFKEHPIEAFLILLYKRVPQQLVLGTSTIAFLVDV